MSFRLRRNHINMRKIIFFLLFASFCFSQEKEFSIIEIDSIINTIKPNTEASGIIKNKKNKPIGGFNITEYKLNNSKTLKVLYSENTENKKTYSYDYFAEIYYIQNEPFYIILTITRKNKNQKDKTLKFELNKNEIKSDKEIKNIFLLNIKNKINDILSQIRNN